MFGNGFWHHLAAAKESFDPVTTQVHTTDEEKKRCEKGSLIVASVKAAKDLFCLALWLWALLVAADALCMKTNASSVASKVAALIHLGPAHLTDKLNLSFHHSFAGRSITKEHCKNSSTLFEIFIFCPKNQL